MLAIARLLLPVLALVPPGGLAGTMTGRHGVTVEALPHGELRRILARHAVLAADGGAGPAD